MDKTVTFISRSTSKNKLSDMYPIFIGSKASEHNDLENMFVEESIELSNRTNIIFII